MGFNADTHRRRSLRLRDYAYTQVGAYFVTVCAYQRKCLFGEVVDGEMAVNDIGRIVAEEWLRSAEIRQEIELDAFVVMPNHIHGIVVITHVGKAGDVGAHGRAPLRTGDNFPYRPPRSLGSFIAGFKSACTKRINELRALPGTPVWQRNYFEHVIRNEGDLNAIREYIATNPLCWFEDKENPEVADA
jgi:REP element-mobilizing transposase RayT